MGLVDVVEFFLNIFNDVRITNVFVCKIMVEIYIVICIVKETRDTLR